MPDVILSIDDFNKLFQNIAIAALGMTEAAATWKAWQVLPKPKAAEPLNPFYFVRIGYAPTGSPAWKQDEDVCFIKCIEIDDPYNKQRDTEFQKIDEATVNQITSYTRVFAISFTAYGPKSFDNLTKIKNYLFKTACRETLAAKQVFLIPNITAALRLPELFQGQYWERTDQTINFNNLVVLNDNVNYIQTVDFTVEDGNQVAVGSVTAPDNISYQLLNEDRAIITTE